MGETELLKKQLKLMAEKIKVLEARLKQNQKDIIKEALLEFTNQKNSGLKSEVMRKFNKNKKNLVKQKILDIIKTKQIPLADLKFYIVNQLNYCSKASFYRYIGEMKDLMEIKNNIVYAIKEITL
ncbi:MAG: hypothetical protein KAU20_04295 [Nanoarchaeota archaeon]|nr:hypothetical protein [Nanoarchaeota archaeon]